MTPVVTPTAIDAFVYIESIRVQDRHRQDLGDLQSLANSILDVGLLNPITITPDNSLVAGQRRLEACRQLGWDSVPTRIVANLDEAARLLRAERDENTERKPMLLSELASLGEALYAMEAESARQRMAAAGRSSAPGRPAERCGELDTPFRGGEPGSEQNKTREVVGQALGMSGTSYNGLRFVYRAANDEEIAPHVRQVAVEALADMDRTGKVNPGEARVRAAIRANREALEAKAAALAAPVEPDELDPLPAKHGPKEGDLDTSWIPAGRDSGPTAVQQRRKLIAYHAGRGASSRQIAEIVGISDQTVRDIARKHDIAVPADDVMARTRKIDSNRVVRETVYALEGSAMGVQLANLDALDPAECDGWVSSMTDSLRVLNRFVKQLKEKTREA